MLELLRDELGCTSVKDGCSPEGSCGACTILVDGHAQVCCAQKVAHFAGKNIVTQEGLGEERRRLWAECFAAAGASQCGYCSPGIVMKAEGFLAKHPEPTREEIAHALLGNLCRCTGYVKVIDAIELAREARRAAPRPRAPRPRRHERAARYGARGARARRPAVHRRHRSSTGCSTARCASRTIRGRASSASTPRRPRRYPGVVAVVTAADVPGERVQGSITRDWPQLVAEGERPRTSATCSPPSRPSRGSAARAAAALVEVEYEVLEPVTDPFDALEEGAPKLHAGGNVLSVSRVQRGDADAALAGAAHVVSQRFRTQRIEHAFLEPESSLALVEDGGVHVYSQGQGIWDDRRQIASYLGAARRRRCG